MVRFALVPLVLVACTPSLEGDAFLPSEVVPPPFDIDLTAPTQVGRGDILALRADMPTNGPTDGFDIYFVVTDGGPQPVCVPQAFGGDCLDVTGNIEVVQRQGVSGGTAVGFFPVPTLSTASSLSVQAVRLRATQPLIISEAFDVQVVDPCQTDALEPDDNPANAEVVTSPSAFSGLNSCDGDDDFVAIDLVAGEMLRVEQTFVHADGDVDLFVYDDDAVSKFDWLAAATSTTDDESLRFIAPETGTYLVRTSLYADGSDATLGNRYDLDIQTGLLPTEDFDNDGCVDSQDAAPGSSSPDLDGDGLGGDCDPCDATGDTDGDGVCDTYGDVAGIWEGTVTEGGTTYPVRLQIGHEGEIGEQVGWSEYPSFGCRMRLTRDSESGGTAFMTESDDPGCLVVQLALTYISVTDTLQYHNSFNGNVLGSATLTRSSVRSVIEGEWWGPIEETSAAYNGYLDLTASGGDAGDSAYQGLCAGDLTVASERALSLTVQEDAGPGCLDGPVSVDYDPVTGELSYNASGLAIGTLHRPIAHELIAGAWTGTFVEPNSTTYPVEITLDDSAAAGTQLGRASYPTLVCDTPEPINQESTTSALSHVVIEEHAPGCVTGRVTLTYDVVADALTYDWRTLAGNFGGSATLQREACHTASFGGHDYAFCRGAGQREDAEAACEAEGMELAYMDTEAENTFVVDEILSQYACYDGISGLTTYWIANDGNAMDQSWPSGESIWAIGEPGSTIDEAIHLLRFCDQPYHYNDTSVGSQGGWVCESL